MLLLQMQQMQQTQQMQHQQHQQQLHLQQQQMMMNFMERMTDKLVPGPKQGDAGGAAELPDPP